MLTSNQPKHQISEMYTSATDGLKERGRTEL